MKLWHEFKVRREERNKLFIEINDIRSQIMNSFNNYTPIYLGSCDKNFTRLKLENMFNTKIDMFEAVVNKWNLFDYILDGAEIRQQLKCIKLYVRMVANHPNRT